MGLFEEFSKLHTELDNIYNNYNTPDEKTFKNLYLPMAEITKEVQEIISNINDILARSSKQFNTNQLYRNSTKNILHVDDGLAANFNEILNVCYDILREIHDKDEEIKDGKFRPIETNQLELLKTKVGLCLNTKRLLIDSISNLVISNK